MRFMLYNIRYGTGGHWYFPWSGYLRRTSDTFASVIRFIKDQDPDILGLVEVDAGSFRSGRQNQAEIIAAALGHYHAYRSKYPEAWPLRLVPVVNQQGNAFVTRDTIMNQHFHYFERGIKRLVIELELEDLTIFLVHLSLRFRIRHLQLHDLYSLVRGTRKPHIVAGDFNLFSGEREIGLFRAATGLLTANVKGDPSFPSSAPRRQLDFILHSPEIRTRNFAMPDVKYSDHLPLVYDFEIEG